MKHCASDHAPAARTVVTPVGLMSRLPFLPPHRSTGTYTSFSGRKAAGNVNGTALAPVVAMAPFSCTAPDTIAALALRVENGAFVQPFCSVSSV